MHFSAILTQKYIYLYVEIITRARKNNSSK